MLFSSAEASAQAIDDRGFLPASKDFNQKRFNGVIIGELVISTAVNIGLHFLWYKKFSHGRFHFFNDNAEWLQMDKLGHSTTAYNISALQYDLMRWSGINRKEANLIGGLTGLGFMTLIEIFDGFSSGWGFSNGDMLFNILGSGLFMLQQSAWQEQRIQFRFSYHNSIFAKYNPAELGANLPQRLLKDYNGQTYWLSFNISSFLSANSGFPRWLNADFGYGAEGMIGGRTNPTEVDGKPVPSFERSRKIFFGAGAAFKRKGADMIPYPGWINILRVPSPVIEWKPGKSYLKFKPFYF